MFPADLEVKILRRTRRDARGCWLYEGGIDTSGYGKFQLNRRTLRTHRVMYQLHWGVITSTKLVVRHTCDVRNCVNPDHLILGTNLDNVADRDIRQRQARGDRNGRMKIPDREIGLLVLNYATGQYTLKQIAEMYGVHLSTVSLIVNGKIRRHIAR